MYQNYQYEVDPKDPLKPLYQGTFEEKVTVGGKERRYLVYIPKGARPSTAGVFILPENGKTADDLWRDSWWRMIADTEETKEKLIVFFLEPENGVWNTDEAYGKPNGDVAYIEQVYLAGAQRFKFCVHEAKFYLTGCREGGVLANMAAMLTKKYIRCLINTLFSERITVRPRQRTSAPIWMALSTKHIV